MADGMENAFDQAFEEDLTASAAAPAPGPDAANTADPAAGDTGVSPQSNADPALPADAPAKPDAAQATGNEDDKGPIPYQRFKQVNDTNLNYEELFQTIIKDPQAYRQLVQKATGRDPFGGADAAPANSGQQAPGPQDGIDLGPELTPEDFALDSDYKAYKSQRDLLGKMAGVITELTGRDSQRQQAEYSALQQRALAEFATTVTDVESKMNVKLTEEQKEELRKEAALYGNSLTVRQATVRAARHMLFDTALQRGRQQAKDIRETKEALGHGGGVAGPTAAPSSTKNGIEAAFESAWGQFGD